MADSVRGISGAGGGYETAEVRDVRRPGGGRGLRGGGGKEWMGCFLDDLRAFGINADQWTTEAQDEGEWRRMAEQGAECIMVKRIVGKKARAGQRHAVVCSNVTGRTKNCSKQAWFAYHSSLATSGANL